MGSFNDTTTTVNLLLIKWQSLFSIVRTESFIHIFPLVILVDGAVDVDYYQIVVENYLSMRLE